MLGRMREGKYNTRCFNFGNSVMAMSPALVVSYALQRIDNHSMDLMCAIDASAAVVGTFSVNVNRCNFVMCGKYFSQVHPENPASCLELKSSSSTRSQQPVVQECETALISNKSPGLM